MKQRQTLRGALSLIEIIIGFFVIAVAGAVLFSNLSSSYRFAGMTRNRTAATLLGGNFVEEVRAHNYGQPAPKNWPTVTTDTSPPTGWDDKYDSEDPNYEKIDMLVYGRPTNLIFYRQLRLENGSFLDKTKAKKTDKVTLQIWWREENANNADKYKSLELEMGVSSPW
jgi:type II secretory pathway pseudopilin PulG